MKITNFAIIFSLLFVTMALPYYIESLEVSAATETLLQYENSLNNAVDDAIDAMVELDARSEIKINRDDAVETFFHSLFINLGMSNSSAAQEQLRLYIPVILITEQDGYYIYHSTLLNDDAGEGYRWEWTEKRPYSAEIDGNIYRFTMSGMLTYYDRATGKIIEGYRSDLAEIFPANETLSNAETFEAQRRFCIIDSIREDLKTFVNAHNIIADRYGITYQFLLPYIDDEEWYRTVDDVSFLAVFQGYPYYSGAELGRFNKYAFGGARISKGDWFYITVKEDKRFYHRSECSEVSLFGNGEVYYTKRQCAETAAFPCQSCNP